MEKELIELLFKYAKTNKIADDEFITIATQIVRKHQNLDEYILLLNHTKLKYDFQSYYSPVSKETGVDIDKIIEMVDDVNEDLFKYINFDEKVLIYNLSVVLAILYTSEHAKQTKNYDTKDKGNIENTLVRISQPMLLMSDISNKRIRKFNKYYLKQYDKNLDFYRTIPDERLANIRANKAILELTKLFLNGKASLVEDYFNLNHLSSQTWGYSIQGNQVISSLEAFLTYRKELLNQANLYIRDNSERELINSSTLPLKQRMLYGLALNKEEILKHNDKIHSTKTYAIFNRR